MKRWKLNTTAMKMTDDFGEYHSEATLELARSYVWFRRMKYIVVSVAAAATMSLVYVIWSINNGSGMVWHFKCTQPTIRAYLQSFREQPQRWLTSAGGIFLDNAYQEEFDVTRWQRAPGIVNKRFPLLKISDGCKEAIWNYWSEQQATLVAAAQNPPLVLPPPKTTGN